MPEALRLGTDVRTWCVRHPSTILRPAHAAGASFYWVKSAEEGPGAGGGGSASGWPDQPESRGLPAYSWTRAP
jgi:hypothetical protein